MSIQFVSALFVAAFCAVNAADLCMDPSKIETVKAIDATKGAYNYFFCQTAVKGKNLEYCKIDLQEDEENTSAIKVYYFNTSSEIPERTVQNFAIVKMASNGEYDDKDVGQLKATTYFLDLYPNECITYIKCFSNGKWAGSEDSGAFVARICPNPALCTSEGSEAMVNKIKTHFLPEGVTLEDTPRDKCVELGMN